MIKQIILITDGCSNEGTSPVIAAAHAYSENIIVNVVGIVDDGVMGMHGTMEIEEIAKAGGGMSRIVSSKQLAKTVQMMTRKTVAHTIQQVVNKELKQIIGGSSITDLPPQTRAHVVQVIEDLGETASLQVALLIDTSTSMKAKLRAVEEAIRDLMLSLQSRGGVSEISVFHFPAKTNREIEMDVNWTKELANLYNLFYKLDMKGTTPTGPALIKLVRFFTDESWNDPIGSRVFMGPQPELEELRMRSSATSCKEGILSDYIV